MPGKINFQTTGWRICLSGAALCIPFAQPVAIACIRSWQSWQFWVDLLLLVVSFGGLSGMKSAAENASISSIGLQVGLGTGLPYLACIALALWCIWEARSSFSTPVFRAHVLTRVSFPQNEIKRRQGQSGGGGAGDYPNDPSMSGGQPYSLSKSRRRERDLESGDSLLESDDEQQGPQKEAGIMDGHRRKLMKAREKMAERVRQEALGMRQ